MYNLLFSLIELIRILTFIGYLNQLDSLHLQSVSIHLQLQKQLFTKLLSFFVVLFLRKNYKNKQSFSLINVFLDFQVPGV